MESSKKILSDKLKIEQIFPSYKKTTIISKEKELKDKAKVRSFTSIKPVVNTVM